jgi:phenylalanyl-tRNA synthetase beta chain
MRRPELKPRVVELEAGYVNHLLGREFTVDEVRDYLERMRFGVEVRGSRLKVLVPAYRADVLHPIDLVEDIAIAYGYMNFKPEIPKLSTLGRSDELELFCDRVRDLMVGYGFMEVMTLIMSNERDLFDRMSVEAVEVASALNPVSLEHSVARNWLLPSLLTVLEKNRSREYPQLLFELGDCVKADGSQPRKLAGVIAHSKASFSEVKSVATGLLDELGVDYALKDLRHPSFMEGRCAGFNFGFFGELKPTVLSNFGLEVPVAAFELALDGFLA